MSEKKSFKNWFGTGAPWVWTCAGAVSISLLMVFGVLALIAFRGLGYFWPADLAQIQYQHDQQTVVSKVGEYHEYEMVPLRQLRDGGVYVPSEDELIKRYLFKVGNRDYYGQDFTWVIEPSASMRARSVVRTQSTSEPSWAERTSSRPTSFCTDLRRLYTGRTRAMTPPDR